MPALFRKEDSSEDIIGLVVIKRPGNIFLFGFLKNTVDRLFGDTAAICNRLLAEVETVKPQNLAVFGHVSDLLIMDLHRFGAYLHYKTFIFMWFPTPE